MFEYLPGFILGVITAISISVIATTYFPSGDVTYDNTASGLQSTNVQGAIDELYGVCTAEPPVADQIIENAGLEKDPYECRYFFTGANPNNYITFNNELWRILSVEGDGSIKIIKNESIGEHYQASNGSNNWARPATLNTYLNETYLSGLSSKTQSQIIAKDFSIGGVAENDTNLANTINNENSKTWNGKIALPTVSEYIRTNSNKNSCGTTQKVFSSTSCGNTSWMSNNTEWWTLTPYSTELAKYDGVYAVTIEGALNNYPFVSTSKYGVRPTLYLNSSVKLSGSGTSSDPYIIS